MHQCRMVSILRKTNFNTKIGGFTIRISYHPTLVQNANYVAAVKRGYLDERQSGKTAANTPQDPELKSVASELG